VAAIALTLTLSRRRLGAIYLTGDLLGRANGSRPALTRAARYGMLFDVRMR
jgi:hypothetical protein